MMDDRERKYQAALRFSELMEGVSSGPAVLIFDGMDGGDIRHYRLTQSRFDALMTEAGPALPSPGHTIFLRDEKDGR